jgi:hypothetical protein
MRPHGSAEAPPASSPVSTDTKPHQEDRVVAEAGVRGESYRAWICRKASAKSGALKMRKQKSGGSPNALPTWPLLRRGRLGRVDLRRGARRGLGPLLVHRGPGVPGASRRPRRGVGLGACSGWSGRICLSSLSRAFAVTLLSRRASSRASARKHFSRLGLRDTRALSFESGIAMIDGEPPGRLTHLLKMSP